MPHRVPANGASLQARALPDGKLHFFLQLEINHTFGQKKGQLGCCLCFPNGTRGDGRRAPCPGPFQDGKAGHMCLGLPEISLTLMHMFHFKAPSWKCWMLSLTVELPKSV